MTIQHMDNFTIYGGNVGLMLNGVYAEAGGLFGGGAFLTTDPDGISSGNVLLMGSEGGGGGNYTRVRYPFQTAPQTVVGIAMRVWLTTLPPDNLRSVCPISWQNTGNGFLGCLTVDTTGRLQLREYGFQDTILYTTPTPVITANAWSHIECKVTIAGAAGNVEVRVEGIPVIDFDYNNGTDPIAQVTIVNDPTFTSDVTSYFVKDYVVWDGSGTYNNNFLGSVQVKSLIPDSDVDLNWTPNPGTDEGWEILSNIPPSNTEYLTAPFPPPDPYQGTLTNLPANVTSVKGIMTYVRAAKTDGGDGNLQVSLVSNGDTVDGEDRPITVAQTYWRDVFEVDPDTSLPWLPNAVDLAEIKINRTV